MCICVNLPLQFCPDLIWFFSDLCFISSDILVLLLYAINTNITFLSLRTIKKIPSGVRIPW